MRHILTTVLILVAVAVSAQTGYRIEMKIKGMKDTTGYLAYHFGESTYIRDTARATAGNFLFEGKKPLSQGIYFLVLNKAKIFEFVVSTDQEFSLNTSTEDYVKNMVVTGDTDNKLFFGNMLYYAERHQEAEPFIKMMQDSAASEDAKKEARAGYAKVNEKVMAYQDDIIAKHPGTLTARIMKSTKPVVIPDPPKRANGSIDSTFQLRWYRQHFFDNFDLGDDAFLRMNRPVYREKIYEYVDKLFVPQPDSVMKAITFIVDRAKKSQDTYAYAVRMMTAKYEYPEINGLDRVFVYLYDKYYATGEMNFWANEKLRNSIKDAANRIRRSMVGEKGSNLIMQDSNFAKRALYDIKNKYTILYIFDPDCHRCKEETPKLVNFYNQNKKKFDIEVFAVSTDSSMQKMRNYIKEAQMNWITVNGPRSYVGHHQDLYDAITTPSLYILDERKMIIGKKIPAESLGDFFTSFERVEKLKAAKR